MPLCVISGVTGLNTSFFIGFAFVSSETYLDYHWVLSSLRRFYHESGIPDPIFAGTDCEKALIGALDVVFPQTNMGFAFGMWTKMFLLIASLHLIQKSHGRRFMIFFFFFFFFQVLRLFATLWVMTDFKYSTCML